MFKKFIIFLTIFFFIGITLFASQGYSFVPDEAMQQQWEVFNSKYGGKATIRWNASTGIPTAIMGIETGPSEEEAKDVAIGFLEENRLLLQIDVSNLKFVDISERIGLKHIEFKQFYKDLPVENARVIVHMKASGEVISLNSEYQPDIIIDVSPTITPEKAAEVIKADLGIDEIVNQITRFENYNLEKDVLPVVPELIIYTDKEAKAHLAWKFRFFLEEPLGLWVYYIDAETGAIIFKLDDLKYTSGTVTSSIYPSDGGDALAERETQAQYVHSLYYYYGWNLYDTDVTDGDGDYHVSFPGGYYWYRLSFQMDGSKAWAWNEDRGGWTKRYDYPYYSIPSTKNRHWYESPSTTNSMIDVGNLFYHINYSLIDYYQAKHGFNLGYRIGGTAHYGTNFPNAFFNHEDGFLYFGDGDGVTTRQFSRARDVIYHELQHAVIYRIYDPFPAIPGEPLAINEASCDYFAATITNDSVIGEWLVIQAPGYLRDIDPFYGYPEDLTGEQYGDGLIYSSTLWDIRADLEQTKADDIIFNHLYFEPLLFIEGRDACIQTALVRGYGTPDIWTIQTRFAQHGIGNVLLNDRFSDGVADGWTLSGLWHETQYKYNSSYYSLAYNQESTHNYDTGARTQGEAQFEADFTSPHIIAAELNFWEWYQVESFSSPYDVMTVQVSIDGGTSWTVIRQRDSTYPPNPFWSFVAIPLPAWTIGNQTLIRFYFDSRDSAYNNYEGWYIDDMEVVITRLY